MSWQIEYDNQEPMIPEIITNRCNELRWALDENRPINKFADPEEVLEKLEKRYAEEIGEQANEETVD